MERATIRELNNLLVIRGNGNELITVQRDQIIGYLVSSQPEQVTIILTQNNVTIPMRSADGWKEVLEELTGLLTYKPRLKPT